MTNLCFDFRTEPEAKRLSRQQRAVMAIMSDGNWYTIADVTRAVNEMGIPGGPCSISEKIRSLRKPQFGSHTVERRKCENVPGLYFYRLKVNERGGE